MSNNLHSSAMRHVNIFHFKMSYFGNACSKPCVQPSHWIYVCSNMHTNGSRFAVFLLYLRCSMRWRCFIYDKNQKKAQKTTKIAVTAKYVTYGHCKECTHGFFRINAPYDMHVHADMVTRQKHRNGNDKQWLNTVTMQRKSTKTASKSMNSTTDNFWRRNNVDDYFMAFCVIRNLIANQYGKSWYDCRTKPGRDKEIKRRGVCVCTGPNTIWM